MFQILVLAGLVGADAVGQSTAAEAAPAQITVRLPSDAKLYVDDVLSPLTSDVRTFPTPGLAPGRKFQYTLRIEVERGGRTVSATKKAVFRAGETTTVEFTDPATTEKAVADPVPGPAPQPAAADGPITPPKGPPPVQVIVSRFDDKLAIQRFVHEFRVKKVPIIVTKKVPFEVEIDGKKETRHKDVAETQERVEVSTESKPVHEHVDLKQVRILGADGKSSQPAELPELLKQERIALLAEGDSVDPFYLRHVRPGTLVLAIARPIPAVPVPPPAPVVVPTPRGERIVTLPTPVLGPVESKPLRPERQPPTQALASMNKDGKIVLQHRFMIYKETTKLEEIKGPDGKLEKREVTVPVPVVEKKEETIDPKSIQVFGTDGKPIDAAKLPELLRKETPVLISTDGQALDPYYLQFIREGTLILVRPLIAAPA